MKKWIVGSVFVLALVLFTQASWADRGHGQKVLEFKTMVGVVPPYTLAANEVLTRGVRGAGAPWRIDEAEGKLRSNGDLELEVEGLVLLNTGLNPQPMFRAVVSCLSIENGLPVTVNLVTDPFPATVPGGDAEFDGNVSLPSPCIAPIVFVTNGTGAVRWFSVTGA